MLEAFWSWSQLVRASIIPCYLLNRQQWQWLLHFHCTCLEICLSVWGYTEYNLEDLLLWNFYAGYGSSTTCTMKRPSPPSGCWLIVPIAERRQWFQGRKKFMVGQGKSSLEHAYRLPVFHSESPRPNPKVLRHSSPIAMKSAATSIHWYLPAWVLYSLDKLAERRGLRTHLTAQGTRFQRIYKVCLRSLSWQGQSQVLGC